MFLITYSEEPDRKDHIEAYEVYQDALDRYEALLKEDDLYDANLSLVMKSTDYAEILSEWVG